MRLSIIIPAFNEEERIDKVLNSIFLHFKSDFEVIVVTDGCRDDTENRVNRLKKIHNNLRLVPFKYRLGKGGAILLGCRVARGDIIGFIDADEAFRIERVEQLIDCVGENCDCIIASKWKGRTFEQVTEPALRKILSRGWNRLGKWFLGLDYADTQAGAKFFKRKVFDSIDHDFVCRGFDWDVEFLYEVQNKGFEIRELFVPSKHFSGSTFNLKFIFVMFKNFVKLWRSKHG